MAMADMFAHPLVDGGSGRKYTVLLSIVAHTIVIAIAIIVPVVATSSHLLPIRSAIIVFPGLPTVPPALPPPRAGMQQPPRLEASTPYVAPQGIPPVSPPVIGDPFAGIDVSIGIVPGGEPSALAAPIAVSPPPAATAPPLRPGGDIKRPVKIRDATPAYPTLAQAARVEGVVIVEATIGPDGKVLDARVLRSIPLLDAAALDAVRRWEYTPTLLNGSPVAVVMTVTVNFRLR
jgi:protein TonB